MPRFALLLIALVTLATLASAEAYAQDASDDNVVLYDYVVVKGDTCVGIAIKELGDRKAYKTIHKYNKMGPLPHKLEPGRVLRLPRPGPPKPDANLSARRGKVTVQEAGKDLWNRAILGMDLFRRWSVNSNKRSTAEVTFLDSSRLRMRENTIVIIYGPTAGRARRRSTRATLKRGALRTRLAELDGKSRELIVDTPSSEAELDGGSALVSVDDSDTARVSNHEGKPAKLRTKSKRAKRKQVNVAAGMGSKVEKEKEPTPPKPLPATPVWQSTVTEFAGWAHIGATLRGGWSKVDKAAEYRVEISRDDQGGDIVASVIVNASILAFEARGFPPGDYYVSVAARDADKFESAPSAWRKMSSVPVSLAPFGADGPLAPLALADDAAVDPSLEAPAVAVLPGSVVAGDGIECTAGSDLPKAELVLVRTGEVTLRCRQGDVALAPLEVSVVAPTVTVESGPKGDLKRVPRNRAVSIRVAIASDISIDLAKLAVTSSADLTITGRRDQVGAIELDVIATRGAGNSGLLTVGFGKGGPTLTTVPLAIEPLDIRRARRPGPPRVRRWEVGALFGGNIFDDEFELGNSPEPSGVLDGSWLVGARVGHHFTKSFLIELEGTYSEPKFAALMGHNNVIGYRAHALLLLRDGRVRPFALAGFGGTFLNTDASQVRNDTDKEGYWGLGLRVGTGKRSSVRLDVRHRVASGRIETFSNLFEASLGIGWML